MSDFFKETKNNDAPSECLGQHFPSEQARREHYLDRLKEALQDREFRNTKGFPNGDDADILALSDPPYYTACPNPFVEEFIALHGKPCDPSVPYSKEPFAADVSEGKNDPIYSAHSYHTKVPHKAIMRYILHYTQPGDLVFDGFCGTGMTGVAAHLCGDRAVVQLLGYRVEANGDILAPDQEDGRPVWKPFSRLGVRRAILTDLSPAAAFIAHHYNTPGDAGAFAAEANKIFSQVEAECGWLYETKHADGRTARINYTVWSDVYLCPDCTSVVVFWDAAVDRSSAKVKDEFPCPHCSANLSKRTMERAWVTSVDPDSQSTERQPRRVPVLINYTIDGKRFEKKPDDADRNLIEKIASTPIPYWVPTEAIIDGKEIGRLRSMGVTRVHQIVPKRANWVLGAYLAKCKNPRLKLALTATLLNLSWMYRWRANGKGGTTSGTYYICATPQENSALNQLKAKIKDLSAVVGGTKNILTNQDSGSLRIPSNSIDYIFLDPPFGSNLMYSELSFLWEAWLKVKTENKLEAIENSSQGKNINDYRHLMTACFSEANRILKPGRWMTVEFSNTQATVWNAIQTALQEAGFVVANVSALDKQQGSFKAVTTTTAVKQDLVISAYKPNAGLEVKFCLSGGSDDSVWDFVRSHLKYLPTIKIRNADLEFVAERDPRILFDRMIAWFVRHNVPVPMSSQEFQAGLRQRFVERDGMVFLPEQVAEYDKCRLQFAIAPEIEMFVSDERSAIDWLTVFLNRRPSTYQEIHTEFIVQLGAGWKKHESKPELSVLLENNFIQYDGTGDVPSQIHAYLSANHKDQRGLEKNRPALVDKAKDRWYVPDPNKAQDLEKKREKALLKEFETYRSFTGRKIKESRLEVLRAGFRAAWAAKDYQTIIAIAHKLPEQTLQEDEKLLTLYDLALTRSEEA